MRLDFFTLRLFVAVSGERNIALLGQARDTPRSVESTGCEIADFRADGSVHRLFAAHHASLGQFPPGDLAARAAGHRRARWVAFRFVASLPFAPG